jgi:hypothetical protein
MRRSSAVYGSLMGRSPTASEVGMRSACLAAFVRRAWLEHVGGDHEDQARLRAWVIAEGLDEEFSPSEREAMEQPFAFALNWATGASLGWDETRTDT